MSQKFSKLSLPEERRLIAQAQNGIKVSADEIVLRHIGFIIFRLNKKIFPQLLERFGQDMLSEAIPILYTQVQNYNLKYRDQNGILKPVKFVSFIWKRIDGFVIDSVNREICREKKEISNFSSYLD